MDLTERRYRTFDELAAYCERVASAVGLACIHIWGYEGDEALAHARSAGLALQLTNILRDLKEDARRDRVYLPLEDLQRCSYSVEELCAGVVNGPFRQLMEMEAVRAEGFFREAAPLLGRLHPDGRRTFGMMMATYHALLREIRRRPGDVFVRRIRLTWPGKLWIVARWALLPPSNPT
jgi:phytoene synthase